MSDDKHAILMMAYGSPQNLDDMEAYLLDIRGGRPTSPELIEEVRERYEAMGGPSPLNEITMQQAEALERESGTKVYVGMRHWHPYIKDVVAEMIADGISSFTALVMAPHYSSLSVGKYHDALKEALEACGGQADYQLIESWWHEDEILDLQAAYVKKAAAEMTGRWRMIFSAHSLPERVLKMGDPYEQQLKENATMLAERCGLDDWEFAFQSAGASREPWLGPDINDRIEMLAKEAYEAVLAYPIGFICNHVEILYDLDIEAAEIAEAAGMRLSRVPAFNAEADFIKALAAVLERKK